MYRDSRWQRKRLEIMERDGWTCRSCGAKGEGVTLNVHHAYYEAGKKPWEYPNDAMVTWCEDCHKKRTARMKDICAELSLMDYMVTVGLHTAVSTGRTKTLAALALFGHPAANSLLDLVVSGWLAGAGAALDEETGQ